MDMFRKLTTVETTDLLAKLHQMRATIIFKFDDTSPFKAKAAIKGWGKNILCARPANLPDSHREGNVTCNLPLEGDIYFFQASLKANRRELRFDLQSGMYQLIRRKERRLRIPEGVEAYFMTKRISDRLVFLKGILIDFSEGGCRVGLNIATPVVKIDDVISGTLRIGTERNLSISGQVKHRRAPQTGKFEQVFGLQFKFNNDSEKKRLDSLEDAIRTEIFKVSISSKRKS